MAFGINNLLENFSPINIFYRKRKKTFENLYKGKNLVIGMRSKIIDSDIGNFVAIGGNVTIKNSSIGNHSYINSYNNINNVEIGKFSSIASNVVFGPGIHPTHLISTHPAFYSNNKPFKTYADKNYFEEYLPIYISNDVWIGQESMIMGGIKIANGAIVAARSVVTKDVPPYAIVGGVPAKIIKYRFNESTINKLNEIKWWNKDENWLQQNFLLFHNPIMFLNNFNATN